jgi:hypothetical protein
VGEMVIHRPEDSFVCCGGRDGMEWDKNDRVVAATLSRATIMGGCAHRDAANWVAFLLTAGTRGEVFVDLQSQDIYYHIWSKCECVSIYYVCRSVEV